MTRRLAYVLAAGVLCPLVFAAAASAAMLGITSQPSGSTASACVGAVTAQSADALGTPYHVPAGGGEITQWQTIVTGETPGDPFTFAVLRPTGARTYTVVGADSVTVPNPLPAEGIATYPLSTPIAVEAGDTLALYAASGSSVNCFFSTGSTPRDDMLVALVGTSLPPPPGESLSAANTSPAGFTLNLAATLVQGEDPAVTTTAGPAGANAGQAALLSSTVTNNGPAPGAITFTDTVPSGLTIDSAVAGNGNCATSGQTVTCAINGLLTGENAPVDVVVTPSSPGTYTNKVSVAVASGVTDPNAANNSATATLSAGLALSAKCIVPSLKGVASRTARTVLKDLGCRVKTRTAHSKSVHKGSVITTKPGAGTYAYQRTITLSVSTGPKKKPKKKHHRSGNNHGDKRHHSHK